MSAAQKIFFAIPIATTFGLGSWQYSRYNWKVQVVEDRKKGLEDPVKPIKSLSDLDKLQDFMYQRISVTGKFAPDGPTFYVGPRQAPPNTTLHQGGPFGGVPNIGYYLYAPLDITEPSSPSPVPEKNSKPSKKSSKSEVAAPAPPKPSKRVLVNRGWVPTDRRNSPELAPPSEEVTLVAVPRGKEEAPQYVSSAPQGNSFLFVDLETFAKEANLAPAQSGVVLDVLRDAIEPKKIAFPMPKPVDMFNDFYVTPEKHAIYSGTWFALAGALSVAYFYKFKKAPPASVMKMKKGAQ